MIPRFATTWCSDSSCDEDLLAKTTDLARFASDRFRTPTLGGSIRLENFGSRRFMDCCKSVNALHFGDPTNASIHTDVQRSSEHSGPSNCVTYRRSIVILNWPERTKTQPHDDKDNCFLHFDSKGTCGMTVNNDIDDDSATKHGDSHTRNSHRQSV